MFGNSHLDSLVQVTNARTSCHGYCTRSPGTRSIPYFVHIADNEKKDAPLVCMDRLQFMVAAAAACLVVPSYIRIGLPPRPWQPYRLHQCHSIVRDVFGMIRGKSIYPK